MSYVADPELAAFIQALPKTETHLHMEGAMPWELQMRVAPSRAIKPLPSWADDYRFPDFQTFLELLIGSYKDFLTCPEHYGEAAALVFSRQLEQNVRYVEFSIDAFTSELAGISLREVIQAILSAVPPQLEARLFVGFHRDGHSEAIRKTAYDCLDWPEVSGIDIHDVETKPFADWLVDYYAEARKKGKLKKAHAGEFGNAGYVREAIERLDVDRIEHGIRAAEDPSVLELIRAKGITLDVCPISNVKLQASGPMSEHPIRRLLDAGVACTVSTDDPLVFGNRLSEEYIALAQDLGFTRKELVGVARNGWKAALIPEALRESKLAELDVLEALL